MARYVYGVVTATPEQPGTAGIGGSPVTLVGGDGVAALTSTVEEADLRMGREQITSHARVLEEAHGRGTVLPMRLGVVMADDEEVRNRLLVAHHDELVEQLRRLAGKCELRLRVTYEQEQMLREVVAEEPEVARLRASMRDAPPEASYHARIQLGELVADALQRKRDRDAAELLGALAPLALAVDVGEPAHERIVVNASFLVEQDSIGEFDAAVDREGRARSGRMRFKYTGPLPPHSFVDLGAEVSRWGS